MATATEEPVHAPFASVVVALPLRPTEAVAAGGTLVLLEAMKMEHEVLAEIDGVIGELAVAVGDEVEEGQLLLTIAPRAPSKDASAPAPAPAASEGEREDLRLVRERPGTGLDGARAEA